VSKQQHKTKMKVVYIDYFKTWF